MVDQTVTPLSDGGYVTRYIEDVPDSAQDRLHVQKRAADGALVGAEFVATTQDDVGAGTVTALAGGGYVVVTGMALRGYSYTASVFDAAADVIAELDLPGAGEGFQIAASSLSGFLVQSREILAAPNGPPDYNGAPLLTLYDNAGAEVLAPVQLTGTDVAIAALPSGSYGVSWTDGNLHHSFVLNPLSPPDLSAPSAAPTILGVFDDASGVLRAANGGAVDDTSPVVRLAVGELGYVQVSLAPTGVGEDPRLLGGVAVTSEDVARGYVDVTVSGVAAPSTIYAHYKTALGVPGPAGTAQLMITGAPPIVSASDDVGVSQGAVADGGVTDDTTPTLHVQLAGSGALVGATVAILDDGATVGEVTLTAEDIARGSVTVATRLGDGVHHLQSQLSGQPLSAFDYSLEVQAGRAGEALVSAGPGSSLAGGAGADTLSASRGLDTLTGGAGADVFAVRNEPWAPIHVTDFALGVDKLDLSSLLDAAGYTGSDPVAARFVVFESDGEDGTVIRFDRDGVADDQRWPNTIVELDQVSPSDLTWAQLQGAGAPGQVLVSTGPGSTLTGGAGADTLMAGGGLNTLTGGAGTDIFALSTEPWAPIHITDFTPGEDKLDLSALFRAAGYAGADPVADGYVRIEPDSAGGTLLRFDRGGRGPVPEWPNTVIDIRNLAPDQVSASDWIIS